MTSYLTTQCDDCGSVKETLELLDKKLSDTGKIAYNNRIYGSIRCINERVVKDLIYYKQMLLHLQYNPYYYGCDKEKILSKIKTIAQ